AVTADAHRVAAGVAAGLADDVADDVRVLALDRLGRAVAADQLQLVVVRALDPVVVDLVALGARLDAVAAQVVVQVAVLHAEHRPGVGDLVGGDVDGVLLIAVAAAGDLDAVQGQRARVVI